MFYLVSKEIQPSELLSPCWTVNKFSAQGSWASRKRYARSADQWCELRAAQLRQLSERECESLYSLRVLEKWIHMQEPLLCVYWIDPSNRVRFHRVSRKC